MSAQLIDSQEIRTQPVNDCPVCNSSETEFFFKSTDRLHGIPGEFTYKKCRDCETVFQDPMVIPEDLHLCYPKDYYTHEVELKPLTNEQNSNLTQPDFKEKLRAAIVDSVRGNTPKGAIGILGKFLSFNRSLRERAFYCSAVDPYHQVIDELILSSEEKSFGLEIGCGGGQLMYALQQNGWQMDGVEWDEFAAERARKLTGSNVFVGDFRDIKLKDNHYDLVVLHHVVEHLSNLSGVFDRISRVLSKNGKLVIVYPNSKSLGARVWKGNWFPWEVPRHLSIPPMNAIEGLINKNVVFSLGLKSKRTLTRASVGLLSYSRSYKDGILPDESKVNSLDSLLASVEKIATKLGIHLGEESVMVFEKK